MKEGLENMRRALGERSADRKDIHAQITAATTTIQGMTHPYDSFITMTH